MEWFWTKKRWIVQNRKETFFGDLESFSILWVSNETKHKKDLFSFAFSRTLIYKNIRLLFFLRTFNFAFFELCLATYKLKSIWLVPSNFYGLLFISTTHSSTLRWYSSFPLFAPIAFYCFAVKRRRSLKIVLYFFLRCCLGSSSGGREKLLTCNVTP